MADGIRGLEQRISHFEALLEEMKEATREAHSTLSALSKMKKEIDKLLNSDVKQLVHDQANIIVKSELDKLGPELSKASDLVYARVGNQIDKVVALCLGKEFSMKDGKQDLRPILATNLRNWIQEIVEEET